MHKICQLFKSKNLVVITKSIYETVIPKSNQHVLNSDTLKAAKMIKLFGVTETGNAYVCHK